MKTKTKTKAVVGSRSLLQCCQLPVKNCNYIQGHICNFSRVISKQLCIYTTVSRGTPNDVLWNPKVPRNLFRKHSELTCEKSLILNVSSASSSLLFIHSKSHSPSFIAQAPFRSKSSSCGIFGGQNGKVRVYSLITCVFNRYCLPTKLQYKYFINCINLAIASNVE